MGCVIGTHAVVGQNDGIESAEYRRAPRSRLAVVPAADVANHEAMLGTARGLLVLVVRVPALHRQLRT